MHKITSNSVPCWVNDIGTGRVWWEWRHGHWVIAEEPYSAAVPKRRDTNRHK